MYGVNGVGKDTIANELREREPRLVTTSESRMLMYLLGIAPSFSSTYSAGREQYAKLEATPQEQIAEIEQGPPMCELIGNLKANSSPVLNLSHLIFATYLDGGVTYLDKHKPDWYTRTGDTFMNVVAPPETILERRQGQAGLRERILLGTSEIQHHLDLCEKEWDRLQSAAPDATFAVIENIELHRAVANAERVMYGE
jgi:adenylate kinase